MAKLLALVAGARAAHHHLNPTMPYTITNEAPGHEGESRAKPLLQRADEGLGAGDALAVGGR